MKKSEYTIHIVGSGVSGLVAAKVLEQQGFHPTIIEATNTAGGRLKTDFTENYQLDQGFQVLLTAYPMVKKYLDLERLKLQPLLPGAMIFKGRKKAIIGDPRRSLNFIFPSLFSGIGNISDKIKIFQLSRKLKRKTLAAIFSEDEITTLDYLKTVGFSENIIADFFKPFFGGIYLEPDLNTSSRMFEFVFKMFAEGLATIPQGGIAKIPEQLKDNLTHTKFIFNETVKELNETSITLSDGQKLNTHAVLITANTFGLIQEERYRDIHWKRCDNLYFETEERSISKPIIGLVADEEALINNLFYHTSIATNQTSVKELLSVTIVKNHGYNTEELCSKVEEELRTLCGIDKVRFLKHYAIEKALPNLRDIKNDRDFKRIKLGKNVFMAGDYLLNGSLNAAILSGEKSAMALAQYLQVHSPS
ncbi:MAG: FAD-dependent oxidoreductase [Bacteroidota bacterium]